MKQNELKFKVGDRVKLKDSDEPIMMVKDHELTLSEELINNAPASNSAKTIEQHEIEYTGKVYVYWIVKGQRTSKYIHQDMLELAD